MNEILIRCFIGLFHSCVARFFEVRNNVNLLAIESRCLVLKGRIFQRMSFCTLNFSTSGVVSYRDLEAIIEERGVKVDHSTLNRWVINYSSSLALAAKKIKRAVATSWRMDETYIKVKGEWVYLY